MNIFKQIALFNVIFFVFILQACSYQNQYDLESIDQKLQSLMKEKKVPGMSVVIVTEQGTLFKKSYGVDNIETNNPFTEISPVRLASATKVLSSLLFLSFSQDGELDFNAPFGQYFTEAPQDWKSIAIWKMLNHTSGIPLFVNNPTFTDLNPQQQAELTYRQVFDILKIMPLDFEPGTDWHYQQDVYAMLAMVLTENAGKSWGELLQDRVFGPAKMTATITGDSFTKHPINYEMKDGLLFETDYYYAPVFYMGAGYNTTANDIENLFKAINEDQIVNKQYMRAELLNKERLFDLKTEYYGPATVVKTFGDVTTIGHSGGGGLADIRYAPDVGIGIGVFTNLAGSDAANEMTDLISEQLFGVSK